MTATAPLDARSLRADLLLLLTAAIWGFAFVAQRVGMEHVGPFLFNGVRFALGAVCLLVVVRFRRGRRRPSGPAGTRRAGLLLGCVLFLGASFQQIGIVYTTAGKAGFITGLYVVLVPILGSTLGHRIGLRPWIGAVLAAVGLYLLSVKEGFRIELGDALVLASAFFWACHVLLVGRWTRRFDAVDLAWRQFATCAVLSLAAAALLEPVTVSGLRGAAVPILYGGVLSVGVAYTLQVVAQREAQPTAAAILLSLEAVFAALGGWMVLGETLAGRALAGCALMLTGVIVSQLGGEARPPEERLEARAT